MTIDQNNVLRVVAEMKLDALWDVINVYHFQQISAGVEGDDDFMTFVATFMDGAYAEINPHISSRITYSLISGQNVTKNELLPDKPWPFLSNGSAVDDMLPEMVAPYVFWRTTRPRTRTSKFLPPFTEGAWGGSSIPAAAIASMNAFVDDFEGTIVIAGSQYIFGAYNAGLVRFTPVTIGLVQSTYRTQRRRRIGIGS